MKTSIQTKLQLMCVLLVILATGGISASTYILIRQDKDREFHQRIHVAFDIIQDDFGARQLKLTEGIDMFLSSEILGLSSARYMEDKERLSSISFISSTLAKAAAELTHFGSVNSVQQIALYGADRRLLAAYKGEGTHGSAGIYARVSDGANAYLPADDPALLTPMLLGREEIPNASVPGGIAAEYEGEIPERLSEQMFVRQDRLGVRISAPLMFQEELSGILLVEFYYTKDIVERNAGLSETEINLFAGDTFSVGTLPQQQTVDLASLRSCQEMINSHVDHDIVPVTFGPQSYYQLQCALGNGEEHLAALTISLSQEIERQAVRKVFDVVLLVSAAIFGLTLLLSWFFSHKIVRPLRRIASQIHQISDGDISHVFEDGQPASEAEHESVHGEKDELAVLTRSFHDMAEYLQGMATLAETISEGDSTQTIQPRSGRDVLGKAFREMVEYIQEITNVARTVSGGDLLIDVQPRSDRDLLSHSLRKMILYIQGVATVAETISEGNLQVHVQPKSEQDVLNHSLRKMVEYIQEVADITEKISHDDFSAAVMPKSEHDVLNMSLYRMVNNLQVAREKADTSMAEIERQNWIKSGHAELNDVMRGDQEISLLAKHVITFLAEYLEAQVGLLYLVREKDGEQLLQLSGSYAYATRQGTRNEFRFGEGLVGQAALERQSLLFSNIPEGYISIMSGIGEMTPQNILVMPFLYEEEVKGVVELGTLYDFEPQQREFLETACKNIAISFHTAQARVTMRQLLKETQRQSEALQVQQQELRQSNAALETRTQALQQSEAALQAQQEKLQQSNEELRAQTEALQASEEKLQVQQEELRQTNEELEEKTKELEKQQRELQEKNRDLEQSRQTIVEKMKELELSNRYKSEFLANMSHELRTPLNSILILSKLFHENKEGNLTEKQKTSAEMIYTAVTNWAAMIDDVLALSEMDNGKFNLELADVSISSLVEFMTDRGQKAAEENGLTLTLDTAEDLPLSIKSDRQRVEQILGNLMSNALKFTEQGEIRVAIALSEHQDQIEFTISDTGIGISKDKQTRIFEAFQQVDGTTTRKYGGVGLGLSLSQQLAQRLGGEIRLHSEEGKGSRFTLSLPQNFQQTEDEGERRQPLPPNRKIPQKPESGAVLLLGEENDFSANIETQLAAEGLRMIRAATVQDAYSFLQAERCLCVIADFACVEFAGVAFLKQSVSGDSGQGIPIVLYTATELSQQDEMKLQAHVESIIVEGERAQERLLNEVKRLTAPPSQAADDIQEDASHIPGKGIELNGKTLLIVDDDIRNLYALSNALEEQEIHSVMATNGKEALEQLEKHPETDLILMDLMMPEMDGYEAIANIRKQYAYQQLPIIVLTAKAMKGDREKCLDAGANDYLSKPVDLHKLLSLLRVWLTN